MALDTYIRSQLAKAAETYASSTDIDARLQAILTAGEDTGQNGTMTTDYLSPLSSPRLSSRRLPLQGAGMTVASIVDQCAGKSATGPQPTLCGLV
jgi:hypothetical protein